MKDLAIVYGIKFVENLLSNEDYNKDELIEDLANEQIEIESLVGDIHEKINQNLADCDVVQIASLASWLTDLRTELENFESSIDNLVETNETFKELVDSLK